MSRVIAFREEAQYDTLDEKAEVQIDQRCIAAPAMTVQVAAKEDAAIDDYQSYTQAVRRLRQMRVQQKKRQAVAAECVKDRMMGVRGSRD